MTLYSNSVCFIGVPAPFGAMREQSLDLFYKVASENVS